MSSQKNTHTLDRGLPMEDNMKLFVMCTLEVNTYPLWPLWCGERKELLLLQILIRPYRGYGKCNAFWSFGPVKGSTSTSVGTMRLMFKFVYFAH